MQKLIYFQMPPEFRGRGAAVVQLWWFFSALFFKMSPQFMYCWRNFILRLFGAKIGRNVKIRPTVNIQYPWRLTIGDYSWIGDDVCLYTLGEILIGSNVVISQKCYLCAADHDYSKRDFPIRSFPIVIEDEVWIATDVYVAPGLKIGHGAVIGARSSVFKDMPSKMVCMGSPCHPVKPRYSR